MMPPPEPDPANRSRNRRALAAVVAACVAPTVIAWLLVSDRVGWQPARLDVHGELLAPQTMLPEPAAAVVTAAAGEREGDAWTLLYVAPDGCDATCDRALERLLNAHLGTGKGALFLRRLVVTRAGLGPPPPEAALAASPPLRLVEVSAPDWPAYAPLLGTGAPAVLVADPAGRVVLRYPAEFPMKGLIRDVKRLLKAAGAL